MGFYVGPAPMYIEPDIVLQTSGDNFFVRQCKDTTYKPNQYIGEECLTMFQMVGTTVRITDWTGKTIKTINY